MKTKTIEEWLRRVCRAQRARQDGCAAPAEPDYALLARVAEGTALPEEQERARRLLEHDAALAAALESHRQHGGLPAERPPHTALRAALTRMAQAEVWLLRMAACAVLVAGATWLGLRAVRKEPALMRGMPPDSGAWNPVAAVQMTTYDIEPGSNHPRTMDVYRAACALLIGIDEYDVERTGFTQLKHCAGDLAALEAQLRAYQFTDITRLANRHATRHNILDKLEAAMRRAGPQGSLLVYFAGHGCQDPLQPQTGYVVPYDGSRDERLMPQRNIPIATIKAMAQQSNIRHLYVVLDCCYAGLIFMRPPDVPGPALPDFHYVRDLVTEPVVHVLAATAAAQPAIDGLFGRVFCETLARMANRPFVTASMVNEAVTRGVARRARTEYAQSQIPLSSKLRGDKGDYIFVPTNMASRTATLRLQRLAEWTFPAVEDCRYLQVSDLNGDGQPDFVTVISNRLCVFNTSGQLLAQRRLRRDSGVLLIADMNGDGAQELLVQERRGTNHVVRVFSDTLRVLPQRFSYPGYVHEGLVPCTAASLRPEYRHLTTNRWYQERGCLCPYLAADIDVDQRQDVLAVWHTGYASELRVALAYDYITGTLKWAYPTAPQIQKIEVCPDDVYRTPRMIVLSTYAPGNGQHAPDGTSDTNSYVIALDGHGRLLWRKHCGAHFTGTSAYFVDMDRDGSSEILVVMRATTWARGVEETGDIWLLNQQGHVLRHFSNTSSVESVCVYPHYQRGEYCVLVALRTGELVLLDAALQPVQRLTATTSTVVASVQFVRELLTQHYGTNAAAALTAGLASDAAVTLPELRDMLRAYYRIYHGRTNVVTDTLGISAHPRICGFMRTSYGEFIVVLQHEHAPVMINVADQIAGPRSVQAYLNVHIKLLDKITLEERFRIPIARWTLDAPSSEHISLFDVDQDGQDELLVRLRDAVQVYKVDHGAE